LVLTVPGRSNRISALGELKKDVETMRSSSRDKTEGTVDKIAGRVMEAFSKLTGNRSAGAKGKAARGRGAARRTKGRAKKKK
jgi:uncharacterized protein YjbJ (UPF0337 family)